MSSDTLLGNIDTVLLGEGFVVMTGWACIPAGRQVPKQVSLTLWDGSVVTVSQFQFRQDLHDAGFGACAFQVCAVTNTNPIIGSTVRLTAENGTLHALRGIGPTTISRFEPIGSLEHVSLSGAWGWIYNPTAWLAPSDPILRFDDRLDIPLPLSISRPDIPFEEALQRPLGFGVPLSQIIPKLRESFPDLYLLDGGRHKYELVTSNKVVSFLEVDLKTEFVGKIEGVFRGAVNGWAVAKNNPKTPIELEILADGQIATHAKADIARPDLTKAKVSDSIGGFRVSLAQISYSGKEATITARPLGSAHPLKGSAKAQISAAPNRTDWLANRPLHVPAPSATIIIPIFNAPQDLALCLDSVFRWTTGAAQLILIDDASTDKSISKLLDQYKNRGVKVYRNTKNMGFTKTCNKAITLATRGDIVLLNSDTIVGPRWLENLQLAAYSRATHGTATPVSNNAGIFSFPTPASNNPIPGDSVTAAARLVSQNSAASFPEVPTGHGFCLYIRRDCLQEVGLFDDVAFPRGYGEENDFCLRAKRLGWTHVLDDRTYIGHRGSASFQEERSPRLIEARKTLDERYPEYTHLVKAMASDPLLHAVRGRVASAAASGRSFRPRVLFVISTETGGTPQTNRDLMTALRDRYEAWLLRCDTATLFLYSEKTEWSEPEQTFDLAQPVQMSDHRSTSYNDIVADILVRHAIEVVHIRHLAWHGRDLPIVAKRFGIPVIFSFHDFYLVCPTVKLLDDKKQFCGGLCTEGDGLCVAELWPQDVVPHLKHRFVHVWRASMLKPLEACDAYVTTSQSAAEIIGTAFPSVEKAGIHVIPHGRAFARMDMPSTRPRKGEKVRIVVPGNLSEAKGAHLVQRLTQMAGDVYEFHLLGDPGQIKAGENVVVHGRYRRDEFQDRMASIKPHLALLLSIWAETWSHTLTEVWACGVPALALDIGAVGERISKHGGGWLLPPRSTPEEIRAKLDHILKQRQPYDRTLKDIQAWQSGFGAHYDTHVMAAHYDRLYRATMHRRLAFTETRTIPIIAAVGNFDVAPASGALSGRLLNEADRRVVILTLPPAPHTFRLEALAVQAILVGSLSASKLRALTGEANDHQLPIIFDSDLMLDQPTTISQYDDLLIRHLSGISS